MKTNNLDAPWVVFKGQIYRADHKPAPFTSTDGKHYPDYHDGLVALAYTDEDKRAIAALPRMLKALEWAQRIVASRGPDKWFDIHCRIEIEETIAAVKGEPTQ